MRTEMPVRFSLSDYTPYPFFIDAVRLVFTLCPDATIVRAVLNVTPHGDGPMFLDGNDLRLRGLRLGPDEAGLTELPPSAYSLSEEGLLLHAPPGHPFVLETIVEISPRSNAALSGLYMSGGRFCTQCEATGFRRITFYPDRPDVMSRFSVRIEADRSLYPYLLSNGTPGEAGVLDERLHFAEWDDPHKKPAYLFALCAGDYDVLRDSFVTCGGRRVDLAIHVDKGEAERAEWAMDCLKRSMRWDEQVYGREYDLGVFNIVAVRDFNFGAMENKGLNIFNSAYVLADEMTATDADFEAIESIVAHEYFHNWTGNRITCRDWFQLCLKEGLTVFRDQNFSADMRSRPVQRIKDVIRLRSRQFAEDAGPLAHPVRPETYGAIDNLYTATVYEKGAELIGMLRRIVGDESFRKGMDIYFARHDGQAVTIEDFYACFEAAAELDLSRFRLWYSQPGTPEIEVSEDWDAGAGRLTVRLGQSNPAPAGEKPRQPVPVPLLCAFLDPEGGPGDSGPFLHVLEGAREEMTFTFGPGSRRPLFSVNRDFSAPVRVRRSLSQSERLVLVRAETDPFNIWDGFQELIKEEILAGAAGEGRAPDTALAVAIADVVRQNMDDPAFAALLTRLPDVGELFLDCDPAVPVALSSARRGLQAAIADELREDIRSVLSSPSPVPFSPSPEQACIRALRAAFIMLLGAQANADELLSSLYLGAADMTEKLAALRALVVTAGPHKEEALADFEQRWRHNPLVMDKWFSVQAALGTVDDVARLVRHQDFDLRNPNRVRSVIASFCMQNLAVFHAPDGSGYRAVEDTILQADKANPALGARLLTAFEQWRVVEPQARSHAKACLERLAASGLSRNSADIVARALK